MPLCQSLALVIFDELAERISDPVPVADRQSQETVTWLEAT